MSYGLLGLQQDMKGQAIDGYARVADLEQRRNQANDNIDAAKTAQRNNNIGAGAGIGFMVGGPAGAAIGAGAGFLFSKFFG